MRHFSMFIQQVNFRRMSVRLPGALVTGADAEKLDPGKNIKT
jgi:hypothetical protein